MYKFKTILFILILLSTTLIGQSQGIRLGSTETQIKSEFYTWTFNSNHTTDGIYYIYSNNYVRGTITYYFNANNVVNVCKVYPYTQGDLNYFAEEYTKHYVVISDTQWKAYTSEGIFNIELIFKDNLSYFIYY